MAYEPKAGDGALFANDRKQTDKQPDAKGSIIGMDGVTYDIAGWWKQGKKGEFLSLRMSAQRPRTDAPPRNETTQPQDNAEEMPF